MTNKSALPAKKSLGQHFLINPGICRKISNLLEPQSGDRILEIGPGPGALTDILKTIPHSRLLLIEKDARWAEFHKYGDMEILQGDALRFEWEKLDGAWKLVGNLPYNIASPLIWEILERCTCWTRAVFMTQKEVAERICAAPHSKKYGALSVWVQAHAEAKLEFSIGPGAFRPPPKVDSSVVSFLPARQRPQFSRELAALLRICFQQRRKQLGSIFQRARLPMLRAALEEMGISAQLRPEDLSNETFQRLAATLAQGKGRETCAAKTGQPIKNS